MLLIKYVKTVKYALTTKKQLRRLLEVGAGDVQGLPLLAQPAPRQSYAPMAGKPAPSSRETPMIQRLNEESGCQENVVLSTWR